MQGMGHRCPIREVQGTDDRELEIGSGAVVLLRRIEVNGDRAVHRSCARSHALPAAGHSHSLARSASAEVLVNTNVCCPLYPNPDPSDMIHLTRSSTVNLEPVGDAMKWGLPIVAATLPFLFAGIVFAQNWNAPPRFGSRTLRTGFTPDPVPIQVYAGGQNHGPSAGIVDAATGQPCQGWFNGSQPDFRLHYTAGGRYPLRIFVQGSGDTTLLVNTPNTSWRCNDDGPQGSGVNPVVHIQRPATGQYDIWVGTYNAGPPQPTTLYITELVTVGPDALPGAHASVRTPESPGAYREPQRYAAPHSPPAPGGAVTIHIANITVRPTRPDGRYWDGIGNVPYSTVSRIGQLAMQDPRIGIPALLAIAVNYGTRRPDIAGRVELFRNGFSEGSVELPRQQDTVQYQPYGPVGWRNMPTDGDPRIRVQLWDIDLENHDSMGSFELNSSHLSRAYNARSIHQVNVSDQTSGSILFVGISTMVNR